VDISTQNFSLKPASTLVNAGSTSTPTVSNAPFPSPLFPPTFHPPIHTLTEAGKASARPTNGVIDVGAFEQQ